MEQEKQTEISEQEWIEGYKKQQAKNIKANQETRSITALR